ncbi:unnamed protein product [Vitrella brassicaformis CCMP3155]|uniref:Molybdate-anion transporter n=2 Tax=Vitrella brassicaformis TaxID=1169539 RepID=A0A0G4FRX5_VITBC|nr:unnamed protein product [Vitrella brassicaformis CCMP3155]|mmetsp:Transcript_33287/g.96114  ORF Transcript_33287/g.96114 Transcript_33287/m.96114 type:complete len:494 (+) Transcript_33287:176-1657(+)|eukprot:CEM16856.1 unnamed protein product [Vitrella brassicaformis CCMP3155]
MANLEHLPVFLVLAGVAGAAQWRLWTTDRLVPANQYAFKGFQRNYLLVYYVMMLADWLQGPYVYALYQEYGFSMSEIGVLFIVGFGASGIMGVFIGSIADSYGRRFICIVFAAIYVLSCITKHFNNFAILLLGRLFAGIATSILFSGFDAWMVHEHHHRKFQEDWLGQTFSRATFGNGLVAIIGGLIAAYVADIFGKVAPFDVALLSLLVGAAIIVLTWPENYGSSSSDSSMKTNVTDAIAVMKERPEVLACGFVQSFFEGAMYTFVFMWTPSLPDNINHGLVFSCFMVAIMIGSAIFSEMSNRGVPLTMILLYTFCVGAPSLLVPAVMDDANTRLAAFLVFEVCCGVYFPSYYTLRSSIVPDQGRATILNFYRVPLNLIVVVICTQTGNLSTAVIFLTCFAMLCAGGWLTLWIHERVSRAKKDREMFEQSQNDEEMEGLQQGTSSSTGADGEGKPGRGGAPSEIKTNGGGAGGTSSAISTEDGDSTPTSDVI